jgi:hypothetical protein
MIKSRLYGSNSPGSGGGGGGGSVTTKKTQSFDFIAGETEFEVTNGTVDQLDFVEVNGNVQDPGASFTVAGNTITLTAPTEGIGTLVIHYFEDISIGAPVAAKATLWNFAANAQAFPVAVEEGEMFLTTDSHGVQGEDADYVGQYTLLIALIAGANSFADYERK